MARSAALNPASMPFFPGGIRASEDEVGSGLSFAHHIFRENRDQDHSSMSSLSISPSEYRSVRSSPSPPQEDRGSDRGGRVQSSPAPPDSSKASPTFRQVDASKPYPALEMRLARESSMMGSLDTLPEGEDHTPGPMSTKGGDALGASFFTSFQQPGNDHLSTPPIAINNSGSSFSTNGFTSSSPVSSLDSGSQFAPSNDRTPSFEQQLKASPMFNDILDRLVRCEYSTREIQRDLGDVHRKVNLLVERSLGVSAQPEFKDPFAPNTNGQSFSSSMNGPRSSIGGNIAPNQTVPSDDITTISQRLNTLTSSVGQLLALQTQQHLNSTNSSLSNNQMMINHNQQGDLAPHQMMSPPMMSNASILGHGLPNRPDLRPSPRAPNPPMRTWSAGALDLPMRPTDSGMARPGAMLGDKRRSVSGLLRRDSAGVSTLYISPSRRLSSIAPHHT